MNHCEGSNPVIWLRENWHKLIETVQHLATKYGHELRTNTIGTISSIEARESLRMHKGNIWRAVTHCIEQRQRKYSEIASRGNFTREDIVTSLTAHHGNMELALIELNKTQLKPFLLKIWGPPSGADNDSGNYMITNEAMAATSMNKRIGVLICCWLFNRIKYLFFSDPKIEEYLNNVIVQENDGFYVKEYFSPSPKSMSFQSSSLDYDQISESGNFIEDIFNPSQSQDYNLVNNANLLKDIESLIQNMEMKQTKDNESTMLDNIDSILSNIKLNESRPHSPQSNLSAEPIRMKSPIMLRKQQHQTSYDIMDDIRHFVTNNIQDIVPDLVNQVELEITRDLGNRAAEKKVEDVDSLFDVDEFMAVNMISGNLSPDLQKLEGHDDFLRHRREEEFHQIKNESAENLHKSDDDDNKNDDDDLQQFILARHNAEFEELNDELDESQHNQNVEVVDASHDSINEQMMTPMATKSTTENNQQQFVSTTDTATTTNEKEILNNDSNLELQVTTSEKEKPFEPLKYKSSFNLKVLKQPITKKRTKSEREFKKRNSLIFENVLLGRNGKKEKIATEVALSDDLRQSQSLRENDEKSTTSVVVAQLNGSESNISQIIENETHTNHSVNSHLINEDQQPDVVDIPTVSQLSHEQIESSVVEIIINDEIQPSSSLSQMNDDLVEPSHENVEGNFSLQSLHKTSANASESDLSSKATAPQNLSELVEDTQRLIKQMKDEINAIYLSDEDDDDDDLTMGSEEEESEYSDEWVDGEYLEEEESEYEDWSGGEEYEDGEPEEFVEEFDEVSGENSAPAENDDHHHQNMNGNPIIQIFIADDVVEDNTDNINTTPATTSSDNNEPLSIANDKNDIVIVGNDPTEIAVVVNNKTMESVEVDSIVHGKLEIQPATMSSISNDAVGKSQDDDALNLNNVTKDETSHDELINNSAAEEDEKQTSENSSVIKMIVSEAINDVISAVVDTSEIISGRPLTPTPNIITSSSLSLSLTEHNSTIINSAMNNSMEKNIPTTEIMAKVSHQNDVDDSITSGNVLSDENEIIDVISSNVNVVEMERIENGAIEKSTNEEKSELVNVAAVEESVKPLIIEIHSGGNDVPNGNQMSNDSAPLERIDKEQTTLSVEIDEKITDENNETKSPSASADILMSDEATTSANISASSDGKSAEKSTVNTGTKSKIPSSKTTKSSLKRKNSIQKDSTGKSTSPDKIKEITKKSDDLKSQVEKNTKPPQNVPTSKRNSFDIGNQRKKSITTPFGLLASSNVKNLQKEFLNKSSNSSEPTPKIQSIKPKPSKLVPPKILAKDKSAPTFANKLTKMITPSSSEVSSASKLKEIATTSQPQRDHSKDVVPEKKYMEHCFSDEYPTTTDDEDEEEIDDQNKKTTTRSFFIKKQPSQESDEETSDVSEKKAEKFFQPKKVVSAMNRIEKCHICENSFHSTHLIQPQNSLI